MTEQEYDQKEYEQVYRELMDLRLEKIAERDERGDPLYEVRDYHEMMAEIESPEMPI